MSNFRVIFNNPWFLLLIIPAVALVLALYFRVSKKYRRTRNRVTSVVLQLIVLLLNISVLAGAKFAYTEPILKNEVMLVVDLSHSNKASEEKKNEFIKDILEASDSIFQMGIVTFGKGQVYAAELNYDTDKVFEDYLNAERPDDSATDIAAALEFAARKFNNSKGSKIVLITDGIETDGSAMSAVMNVVLEGIRVDTVLFSDKYADEAQLIGVELPDYNIVVGDTVKIGVTVQSSYSGKAEITLSDNGTEDEKVSVNLIEDVQTFYIDHTFLTPGAHEICFSITSDYDTLKQNNIYYSYIYLEVFDRILIVERTEEEADKLETLIKDDFNVEVVSVASVPNSVDELRQYDQIILMNIAYGDMPNGFEEVLYSYVYEYGGGLLTVGGNKVINVNGKDEIVANAYNRDDMDKSQFYKKMLPVEVIDYTPPLALIIVIDCSGSMREMVGQKGTRMDLAKEGAVAAVNALSERDWVGVVTFDERATVQIPLTEVSKKMTVLDAISNMQAGVGGTIYRQAIDQAGLALQAISSVEKKHIIFVTDGEPQDNEENTKWYKERITEMYENLGITFSAVGILGDNELAATTIQDMADLGGGRAYPVEDVTTLPWVIREELRVDAITDYIPESFRPVIKERTNVVSGIVQGEIPVLGGFYGVRTRNDDKVQVSLVGKSTSGGAPIYAQWKYGQGRVGSFMCDLNGYWSEEFMNDSVGIRIINNIIKGLFPAESIRPRDIYTEFKPHNYSVQIEITTDISPNETLEAIVTSPLDESSTVFSQNIKLERYNSFARGTFTFSESGIYEVKIIKKDLNDNIISEYTTHTVFSYSSEYNVFADKEYSIRLLTNISRKGKGSVITEAVEVFKEYDTVSHETINPQFVFIIISITLFLLDIAVRKFKWKWPWEIIRDNKAKELLK